MVKMELKSRMAFPVFELLLLTFILMFIVLIMGSSRGGGSGLDHTLTRIRIYQATDMQWISPLSTALLFLSLMLSVLVSVALAGEYEHGLITTYLSLPLTRSQYLGAKYVVYFICSIIIVFSAFVFSMLLTPYQLTLPKIILSLGILGSSVMFFLALSVFIAVYTRKTVHSFLVLLTLDLLFRFVGVNFQVPLKYFFVPTFVLLETDLLEPLTWGVLLPIILTVFLIYLSFHKFQSIDILGDHN